jgi:hypothetical protein
VAAAWRGLPTTPDWGQVALRLSRAQAFSPALPADRQRTARLTPGSVYTSPLAPLPQPRSLTLASNSSAHAHVLATGDFSVLQRRLSEGAIKERWHADEEVPGVIKFPVWKLSKQGV